MDKFINIKEYFKKLVKFLSKDKGFEFLYNRGIDFYNKKKYEQAITCFELALEKPQVQPQVYYNLALSYQYLNKYEKALSIYNKFLGYRPNDYDGLYNIALTYYSMSNYKKAVEYFEKCILIKKDEDGVRALTLAYFGANEIEKAMEFTDSLDSENPAEFNLLSSIAGVFESKNSLNKDFTYINKAIEIYDKLTEKNPEHFKSYLSLSICYAKKGEWENSVEYCKKALENNPDSYEANNQMGLVYYCCNNIDESIKYYETALNLKPQGDYKIYSNLAYAYEKKGDIKKSLKMFSQLVNNFPKYPAREEVRNHMRILKSMQK